MSVATRSTPAETQGYRRTRIRQERLTAAAFLLPALGLSIVVLYVPFLYTSYLSMTEFNGLGDPEFVGLDKYREMFADAGFPVARPELSALFRQPGHKNYRACGDQLLRAFLKGLTLRVRGAG